MATNNKDYSYAFGNINKYYILHHRYKDYFSFSNSLVAFECKDMNKIVITKKKADKVLLILWNLLSLQKKMLVMLIKNRIEFIDIAKGFTILIIVLTHTYGDSGGSVLEVLSIFKVPTFFALSGLFFKDRKSVV